MRLEEKFGLDREHARIQLHFLDKSFVLTLGGEDHDDGIAVLHENGKYFIQPRNYGEEPSDEIAPEVAQVLLSVLWKIQNRLNSRS